MSACEPTIAARPDWRRTFPVKDPGLLALPTDRPRYCDLELRDTGCSALSPHEVVREVTWLPLRRSGPSSDALRSLKGAVAELDFPDLSPRDTEIVREIRCATSRILGRPDVGGRTGNLVRSVAIGRRLPFSAPGRTFRGGLVLTCLDGAGKLLCVRRDEPVLGRWFLGAMVLTH